MNRSGLELYEWFEVEGVFSLELSDEDANAIVTHAMSSQEPEFIRHAVMGMGWHAPVIDGLYEELFERKWQEVVPSRSFDQVPRLKEFLMDYYREGEYRNGTGFQTEAAIVNGIAWVKIPAWKAAPSILATYFPNDPEVHDFIFETHEDDQAQRTLILLSSGKFRTDEADRFRIECLDRDWNRHFRQFAATALGEFQTPSGLRALEGALKPDHPAISEVVKALMSFDESVRPSEALQAFAARERKNAHPDVRLAVQEIENDTLDAATAH